MIKWRRCVRIVTDDDGSTAAGSEHDDDTVHRYAQSVVWYGLLDLCHRDVIREADGLGMMAMWRINMIRFWNGRHCKYLRAGHRLIAGALIRPTRVSCLLSPPDARMTVSCVLTFKSLHCLHSQITVPLQCYVSIIVLVHAKNNFLFCVSVNYRYIKYWFYMITWCVSFIQRVKACVEYWLLTVMHQKQNKQVAQQCNRETVRHLVLSQCTRVTDGRTDGQNYDSQDRPRICSRGKN